MWYSGLVAPEVMGCRETKMEFPYGRESPLSSRNMWRHACSMSRRGPRVAAELQRPARRVLIGRSADWLSQEGGVRKLIAALRSERGQPKVPEMSELRMLRSTSTARESTVARAWGTSSSERLRPTREHSSPWPGIKESQDLRTCEKRTAQCNVHEEVHEQPGR